MRSLVAFVVACCAAFWAATASSAAVVISSDTTIDSTIANDVEVIEGATPPTVVTIVPGGSVGMVTMFNGSVLRVQAPGAVIGSIRAKEHSVVEVSDGTVWSPDGGTAIGVYDSATVRILGGVLNGADNGQGLGAGGTSRVEIWGGQLVGDERPGLVIYSSATAEVHGGTISAGDWYGLQVMDLGQVTLLGGEIKCDELAAINIDGQSHLTMRGGKARSSHDQAIATWGASRLDIYGGSLEGDGCLTAYEQSVVRVFGGSFTTYLDRWFLAASGSSTVEILGGNVVFTPSEDYSPPIMRAMKSSTILIYGHDFNYPLGKISDSAGVIRGVLADGEAFEWGFSTDANAAIYLVPEPATVLLLALAGLIVAPILVARVRPKQRHG